MHLIGNGLKAVYDKSREKWRAEIKVNYKNIYLGRFNTLEEAILAREKGNIKYHGIYGRGNLIGNI